MMSWESNVRDHVWRAVNVGRDVRFAGEAAVAELPQGIRDRVDGLKRADHQVWTRVALVKERLAFVMLADSGAPTHMLVEIYARDGDCVAGGRVHQGMLSWR